MLVCFSEFVVGLCLSRPLYVLVFGVVIALGLTGLKVVVLVLVFRVSLWGWVAWVLFCELGFGCDERFVVCGGCCTYVVWVWCVVLLILRYDYFFLSVCVIGDIGFFGVVVCVVGLFV